MKMKKLLMLAVATVTAASCLSMSAQTYYANETSKVGTSKEAWHGTGTYDKDITPLGGSSVKLVEHYYSPKNNWGSDYTVPEVGTKPLYQSVANLPAGTYKVEFYVTAHKANDEGADFALPNPSETANVAYVKVGDNDAITKAFTSIANNGLADNEPILVTFDKLLIPENATLEMGIELLEKNTTNWYTIQISSLQREVSEGEAAQSIVDECHSTMQALLDKYQYASDAAKAPYVAIINSNPTTLTEAEALRTQMSAVLKEAKNERLLAETDAVLASLNGEFMSIVNPDGENTISLYQVTDETVDTPNGGWYGFKNGASNFNFDGNKNGESPTLSNGNEVAKYFDGWGDPQWRLSMQQNVALEPGEYRLSVLSRAQQGLFYFRMLAVPGHNAKEILPSWSENNTSNVSGYKVALTSNGASGGLFGRGWELSYLDFTVEDTPASAPAKEGDSNINKQNVCIAVQSGTDNNHSGKWHGFTHFQLVKKPKDIGSGISNAVVEDVNAPVEYFDLNGIRVNADNLNKGIYIKRQGNKVTKIIK